MKIKEIGPRGEHVPSHPRPPIQILTGILCCDAIQVMEMISTIAGDRALTDQQHLGITGCSMGGLFSCYAGNKMLSFFENIN